jgi:hypothetical protein
VQNETEPPAERQTEIQALETSEAYTIQHEMLLYLKIWEMDAFIKNYTS